MFEGDDQYWWVTGGSESYDYNLQQSTEIYDVLSNQFNSFTDIPYATDLHTLVNVNNTHTVLLSGREESSQVYMYNR